MRKQLKGKPLGYMEIESGSTPVHAMNDIFLNYMFKSEKNWEVLRSIINIVLEEYIRQHADKGAIPNLVHGEIDVTTQYEFMRQRDRANPRQDMKVTGEQITYIEFQNRAKPKKPIKERAIEYFGLGLGHSKGTVVSQVWLLAENPDDLISDNDFSNYLLQDIVTGSRYPDDSGIMFVSLQGLSKLENKAGQLARFLLGINTEPTDKDIIAIKDSFSEEFSDFRVDKEASSLMTFEERVLDKYEPDIRYDQTLSIATIMLKDNEPIEKISRFTKLSREEIEELMHSM